MGPKRAYLSKPATRATGGELAGSFEDEFGGGLARPDDRVYRFG